LQFQFAGLRLFFGFGQPFVAGKLRVSEKAKIWRFFPKWAFSSICIYWLFSTKTIQDTTKHGRGCKESNSATAARLLSAPGNRCCRPLIPCRP
jgi:hypothetical protein